MSKIVLRAVVSVLLFILLTIVLGILVYYNPKWIGVFFFVELFAAQVFTRYMVALQVKFPDSDRAFYPYVACLVSGSFIMLAAVGLTSCYLNENLNSMWYEKLAVLSHLWGTVLFIVLYLFFTRRDEEKSKRLARMSEYEINCELASVRNALEKIKDAERVLQKSSVY